MELILLVVKQRLRTQSGLVDETLVVCTDIVSVKNPLEASMIWQVDRHVSKTTFSILGTTAISPKLILFW